MDEPPDTSAACSVKGLLPVHGELPEVVILGSFPSRQSLLKKEYFRSSPAINEPGKHAIHGQRESEEMGDNPHTRIP